MGGKIVKKECKSLGSFVILERPCCIKAVPEMEGRGGRERGTGLVTSSTAFATWRACGRAARDSVNPFFPSSALPK